MSIDKKTYRIEYTIEDDFLSHISHQNLEEIETPGHFFIQKIEGDNILDFSKTHLKVIYIKIIYSHIKSEIFNTLINYTSEKAHSFIYKNLTKFVKLDNLTIRSISEQQFMDLIAPNSEIEKNFKITGIYQITKCDGCRINSPGLKEHIKINGCLFIDNLSK